MIKVAVFDDHTERREALALLVDVQPDMQCTGAYENCAYLVEDLKPDPPHVALMDLEMPEVDGMAGVRLLRQHFPDTLIIIQTVFEDNDKIFPSIQHGAHGYVLKETPPEKLIEAIRDVLAGGAPMTSSIASRVLQQFRAQGPAGEEEAFKLTERELEIVALLTKGYSRKMVSAELGISQFTVNNHVKKIYQKLQVHSASGAVSVALQQRVIR